MNGSWFIYACVALGISSALVAGVFQSFSDFVMRGLAQAPPLAGMQAMQGINVTVMRSAFIAILLGLVPALLIFAGYVWLTGPSSARGLIGAAAAIYVVTVFGVTALGNVPMNNQLASLSASDDQSASYWAHYCRVWTRWNHVRTVGSAITAVFLILAALSLAAQGHDAVMG